MGRVPKRLTHPWYAAGRAETFRIRCPAAMLELPWSSGQPEAEQPAYTLLWRSGNTVFPEALSRLAEDTPVLIPIPSDGLSLHPESVKLTRRRAGSLHR